jgi:hypothetical protein
MTMPNKELMASIYIQTMKTNDRVTHNEDEIKCLKDEMKDKIGWKLMSVIGGLLGVLIIVFNIINILVNAGKL